MVYQARWPCIPVEAKFAPHGTVGNAPYGILETRSNVLLQGPACSSSRWSGVDIEAVDQVKGIYLKAEQLPNLS